MTKFKGKIEKLFPGLFFIVLITFFIWIFFEGFKFYITSIISVFYWEGLSIINGIILIIYILLYSILLIYLLLLVWEFFFTKHDPILLPKIKYELSDKEKEKLFVMIPAYNEEDSIETAIHDVRKHCSQIVVVDDGSTDSTYNKAKSTGVVIVKHSMNMGLGQAYKDGLNKCIDLGAEIVVVYDADRQFLAEDIPIMAYYILNQDYELILGSRFKGEIEEMSSFKKIGNKTYTQLVRFLTKTGYSDAQTGFRAIRSDFARRLTLRGGFNIAQEMLIEAYYKRAKIGEIPVIVEKNKREDGKSRLIKNPLDYAFKTSHHLLKVYLDLKPLYISSIFFSVLFINGSILIFITIINATIYQIQSLSFLLIGLILILLSFFIIIIGYYFEANSKTRQFYIE